MQESEFLRERDDVLHKLKAITFLDALGKFHAREILNFSKLRVYDAGEMITQEELPDAWLYLLVSGEVVITKNDQYLLELSQIGEAFGEISFLDGSVRSATVRAKTKTVCLAINADLIEKLPLQHRAICFATLYRLLAEVVAQRLRRTNEELQSARAELRQLRMQRDPYFSQD